MATQIIRQQGSITAPHNGESRRQMVRDFFSTANIVLRKYFGPGHSYYLDKDYLCARSAKEKAVMDACRFGIPLQ